MTEYYAMWYYRSSTLFTQVYSGRSGRAMVFTSTKSEANGLALNAVLKQVSISSCATELLINEISAYLYCLYCLCTYVGLSSIAWRRTTETKRNNIKGIFCTYLFTIAIKNSLYVTGPAITRHIYTYYTYVFRYWYVSWSMLMIYVQVLWTVFTS